jgi:hypothetical protein
MGGKQLKRKHLVKNFPRSFTYSALCSHFTSEYKQLLGCELSSSEMKTLVLSFMRLWKKTKKKEQFLSIELCKFWLETDLPIQGKVCISNTDHPAEIENTPAANLSRTPHDRRTKKARKPFLSLTERGKQNRLRGALNLEQDELQLCWLCPPHTVRHFTHSVYVYTVGNLHGFSTV